MEGGRGCAALVKERRRGLEAVQEGLGWPSGQGEGCGG